MRLFVAVPVGREVVEAMVALRDAVAQRLPELEVRWQPSERAHLTLLFLGEVDEVQLAKCRGALAAAVRRHPTPTLTTSASGAFPSPGRPSVLWLGVADDPGLTAIQHDVARQFGALRLGDVRGRFRPHLTLGRLRGPAAEPEALMGALAEAGPEPLSWRPTVAQLVRSRRTRSGVTYEVLVRESFEAPDR